jgi:hypothetical protein
LENGNDHGGLAFWQRTDSATPVPAVDVSKEAREKNATEVVYVFRTSS